MPFQFTNDRHLRKARPADYPSPIPALYADARRGAGQFANALSRGLSGLLWLALSLFVSNRVCQAKPLQDGLG